MSSLSCTHLIRPSLENWLVILSSFFLYFYRYLLVRKNYFFLLLLSYLDPDRNCLLCNPYHSFQTQNYLILVHNFGAVYSKLLCLPNIIGNCIDHLYIFVFQILPNQHSHQNYFYLQEL